MLELVRDPGPKTADGRRRLVGERALDVEVVGVDRGGHRDVVVSKLLGVVEPWPRVLGEKIRGLAMGTERSVVLEHPRVDVLGREHLRVADLIGQEPIGGPACRDAVRVRRLVEGRVDRVTRELDRPFDVRQERPRSERKLKNVVEQLEPGAVAEPQTELPEAAHGELVTGSEQDRVVLQAAVDLADPRAVLRISLEIALVLLDQTHIRGAVDVVHGPPDRGEAAGEERLAEPVGRDRQVGHRCEPAETLPEHAPALHAQLLADQLRIPDDRIRAKMGQVRRLGGRGLAGDLVHRRGPPGPPLVQQQDPVVLQRSGHPAGRRAGRPRGLEAGTALEEQEIRPGRAVGIGDLPGEDGQPWPVGAGVVERDRVLTLGEEGARDPDRRGHGDDGTSADRVRQQHAEERTIPRSGGTLVRASPTGPLHPISGGSSRGLRRSLR